MDFTAILFLSIGVYDVFVVDYDIDVVATAAVVVAVVDVDVAIRPKIRS